MAHTYNLCFILFPEIKMPSSQFYLEVQNSMISSLDASTSVATALELGDTEIKLIDKSILALEIS